MGGHIRHCIHIIRYNRIFQHHGMILFNRLGKKDCFRNIHTAVYLKNQIKIISNRFTYLTDLFHCDLDLAVVEFIVAGPVNLIDRKKYFAGSKAPILQDSKLCGHLLCCHVEVA